MVLNLPSALLVADQVLGHQFSAKIGGGDFDLTFPVVEPGQRGSIWVGLSLPDTGFRGSELLKRLGRIEWGGAFAQDVWAVGALAASTLVETTTDPGPGIEDVARAVDSWFLPAQEWIVAAYRQETAHGSPITRGTSFRGIGNNGEPWGFGGLTSIKAQTGLRGASLPSVIEAFNRSERRERLPLHFRLLSNARSARTREDRRRAVIDAGTATEVSLALALETRMLDRGLVREFAEQVTERANGVVGLVDLYLREIGPLPVSLAKVKDQLAHKRNLAAHSGYEPSPNETVNAVRCAESIVESVTPLDLPHAVAARQPF
jgi:hypothetical protein